MKSQEQNQIEAQSQTIESLTKTVERLERELEKCLDPDSGEFKFDKPEGARPEVFEALQAVGIQPSAFAFFLVEFKKQTGKGELSRLLTDYLKAQADLILLHINA